jgi:CMP/dCMP kinase
LHRGAEKGGTLSRKHLIITIDGPGGAGKSTVAKKLAELLGYGYLDTGAMYRGIAFAYQAEAPLNLEEFLSQLKLEFIFEGITRVFLNGREITGEIRTPEMSLLASSFSQNHLVRAYLTAKQREVGKQGGIVVEGRDTGSVVFPGAGLKIYLDANIHERAERRFRELAERGTHGTLDTVKEDIEKRDRDDSSRYLAPLIRPDDAVYLDTTGRSIDEVVIILEREARGRGA